MDERSLESKPRRRNRRADSLFPRDPFPQKNKVIIRAGIRVIGADGNMYDLEWPDGGGAVTAKLAEDDVATN